jgi:chromosome segregation ATPase
LQTHLKALKDEINSLKSIKEEHESLKQKIDSLEVENKHLTTEKAAAEGKIQVLQMDLSMVKSASTAWENEKPTLIAKIESFATTEHELEIAKERIVELEKSAVPAADTEQLKAAQEEIQKIKAVNEALKAELEAAGAKAHEWQAEVEKMKSAIADSEKLRGELEKIQAEKSDTRARG